MDLDGVTCTAKMNKVILGGGLIEKNSENNFNSVGIHSKIFLGDKYG